MDEQSQYNLESFFELQKKLTYKKREIILRAEDTPHGVYLLTKGYIRIYSISPAGDELTLLLLKAYDFFPVRWALSNEPVRYFYEAMTPVEVLRAPRDAFLTFIKSNPSVFFHFTEMIFARLGTLMQRIEYLVYGKADNKVASILLICADRFGVINAGKCSIDIPLTHKDIASLVGLARETVSVEMAKLEKEGIIVSTTNGLMIANMKKLRTRSLLQTDTST